MTFTEWKNDLAQREPSLAPVLDGLNRYIENERLRPTDLEGAINQKMLTIEKGVLDSMRDDSNA